MRSIYIYFILFVLALPAFSEEVKNFNDTLKQSGSNIDNNVLSELLPEFKNALHSDYVLLNDKIDQIVARINIIEKRELALKNGAKAAFDKAQNLADLGNIKEAGFYYAIACICDPDEGLYLHAYVNAVINWADRKIKIGQPDLALRVLMDMERFLYTNTSIIFPDNAENAFNLLKKIELKSKEAEKATIHKTYNADLDNIKEILADSKALLSINIPDGLDNIVSYQTKLQEMSGRLIKCYSVEPNEELFLMMKSISSRINEASMREESERILAKGENLIILASKEENNSKIYIDEAVLINQRLGILYYTASNDLKRRIDAFNKSLEKIISANTRNYNNSLAYNLRNRYENIIQSLKKDKSNAEKSLMILYQIHSDVIAESAKVTDEESLKEINLLIVDINKSIDEWRNIQTLYYEKWAIKTVIKFNDLYKNEMGMLGSGRDTKNRIYLGMIDYLDLRYLNISALRAYTEVFDFFYKELDRDQRLELSAEFVTCDKKGLSDF